MTCCEDSYPITTIDIDGGLVTYCTNCGRVVA